MKLVSVVLFLLGSILVLVGAGTLLGADCMILVLIALATGAALLASIMGQDSGPSHTLR